MAKQKEKLNNKIADNSGIEYKKIDLREFEHEATMVYLQLKGKFSPEKTSDMLEEMNITPEMLNPKTEITPAEGKLFINPENFRLQPIRNPICGKVPETLDEGDILKVEDSFTVLLQKPNVKPISPKDLDASKLNIQVNGITIPERTSKQIPHRVNYPQPSTDHAALLKNALSADGKMKSCILTVKRYMAEKSGDNAEKYSQAIAAALKLNTPVQSVNTALPQHGLSYEITQHKFPIVMPKVKNADIPKSISTENSHEHKPIAISNPNIKPIANACTATIPKFKLNIVTPNMPEETNSVIVSTPMVVNDCKVHRATARKIDTALRYSITSKKIFIPELRVSSLSLKAFDANKAIKQKTTVYKIDNINTKRVSDVVLKSAINFSMQLPETNIEKITTVNLAHSGSINDGVTGVILPKMTSLRVNPFEAVVRIKSKIRVRIPNVLKKVIGTEGISTFHGIEDFHVSIPEPISFEKATADIAQIQNEIDADAFDLSIDDIKKEAESLFELLRQELI